MLQRDNYVLSCSILQRNNKCYECHSTCICQCMTIIFWPVVSRSSKNDTYVTTHVYVTARQSYFDLLYFTHSATINATNVTAHVYVTARQSYFDLSYFTHSATINATNVTAHVQRHSATIIFCLVVFHTQRNNNVTAQQSMLRMSQHMYNVTARQSHFSCNISHTAQQ